MAENEDETQDPVAEEAEPPVEVAAEADADEPVADAEPAPEAPAEVAAASSAKGRKPRAERRQRTKRKLERPAERKPIVRLPKPIGERGRRQERRGVVVSSTMEKTIVVKVDTVKTHPRYKKVVRRSAKFHAHDEENAAKVGDVVRIIETRPLSKTKFWRLAEIVEAAR